MKFIVLLEGNGFRTDLGNGEVPVGFFASRVAEAEHADAIDTSGLISNIRESLAATGVRATEHARIVVDDVKRLQGDQEREFAGFTFFEEGNWITKLLRRFVGRK